MSAPQDNQQRLAKLAALLRGVLNGSREIKTLNEGQLFFEALRAQESASSCLESIFASKCGLHALRIALRLDISPAFIQTHTLRILEYFAHEQIKFLAGGQLLQQLLTLIVSPPTLWNALVRLAMEARVEAKDSRLLKIIGWISIEILCLRKDAAVEGETIDDIQRMIDSNVFSNQSSMDIQQLDYKIRHLLSLWKSTGQEVLGAYSPGGRHDNDFLDFRDISIYPTSHEFLSTVTPFYRTAQEVFDTPMCDRPRVHLDNIYRLTREDLLAELRNDWHITQGRRRGPRSALTLGHVRVVGFAPGDRFRGWKRYSLAVRCSSGLEALERRTSDHEKKKFLSECRGYLKHQSFGALYSGQEIHGFAFVDRDIEALSEAKPTVILEFTDDKAFKKAVVAFRTSPNVMFSVVGTPVFAYEPVLERLKTLKELPLHDQLVDAAAGLDDFTPEPEIERIAQSFASSKNEERVKLNCDSKIWDLPNTGTLYLDPSQRDSMKSALTQSISIIQGPPGTGKSLIGALVARLILNNTDYKILVISYTNHALDQFLEELMQLNIPEGTMARLGGKATEQTASLLLSGKKHGRRSRRTADQLRLIREAEWRLNDVVEKLRTVYGSYLGGYASFEEVQEYLEFSEDENDQNFLSAFQVPLDKIDEFKSARKGHQQIESDYLFKRWSRGQGPGVLSNIKYHENKKIWQLDRTCRNQYLKRWYDGISGDQAEKIRKLAKDFKDAQEFLDDLTSTEKVETLTSKRIIGCTTTAAAKYAKLIAPVQPDIVIVEEAGEILESHIITALTPSVKQLVLIGDHKQLRPKINNYALTVEKGDGFDLNCSLFERLILQGRPHCTLQMQHRMHPDISILVKELTYPELKDNEETLERPMVRGFEDRVIFMNHSHPEVDNNVLADRRDQETKSSKENIFEADMVLKLVKYLGQQGYGTKEIVVLTPYLGQLRLLREKLSSEVDPWLSDLDSFDLVRAGQLTKAAAAMGKAQLRLSTIDNYQGEESDIVIASLTRSNNRGDIGFLAAPERLNVLLSRARNCIFLFGNMDTFVLSKKGQPVWVPFFESLKQKGHLYDGLPVRCEKHPDSKSLLKEPADFAKHCPDGGCTEPCGAMLNCGIHVCQLRCHRISDHSKMACPQPTEVVCGRGLHHHSVACGKKGQVVDCHHKVEAFCPQKHRKMVACSKKDHRFDCYYPIEVTCSRQHKSNVPCHTRNTNSCGMCIEEDKEIERRAKRNLALERERLARQAEYKQELENIRDEIDQQRRIIKHQQDREKMEKDITQARESLAALKATVSRVPKAPRLEKDPNRRSGSQSQQTMPGTWPNTHTSDSKSSYDPLPPSKAREEWEHLKEHEGAQNKSLDELMSMIGLEDVKAAFLSIKSRIDTAIRQDISLDQERFSCSMLGNPGTGKTTVARLYAKFLTSICVVPGSCFKEETGASLANAGVNGCKKIIDDMLNDGGGVLFIDEAYQLSSGNSYGGGAVLDYLLPEIENLSGKIVFLLAGYNKQMESFFAHNPGLPSRFPIDMKFEDYTDDELLRILELKINKKYNGRMRCEDGLRGLYCRILAKRVGRGRGREGFGNARTIENTLSVVCQRQATRLRRERRRGQAQPDYHLFTKEDLIGPEPGQALAKSAAWEKIQNLIGLAEVKHTIKALVNSVQQNYARELEEQPPIEYSLNRVFLGSPGTGKTTVAKLYGSILADLGLLSKGEVVVKTPSDFVGAALGQSEQQTKGILAASLGKVLVIDEAYGLYGGPQAAGGDPYKTAVIDTIVAEVQSVPGDDRCVLLLGYKEQMENMFQNVNPGLARRFPTASAFQFEDFNDDELRQILDIKLVQQGFTMTDEAKRVAMEILDRARNRPNFGNAGEVDIMLDAAKARHQASLTQGKAKSADTLEALDLDPEFDRAGRSDTNVERLFEGTVGNEETIKLLQGYQETVKTLKSLEMDPKENIPFNFLFRGPPGTGKTTTAKKMGKVFYDLGFLATAEVVECSASELVGQYVGQTGPKVQKLLDKALGRVLFVDEAYRLAEGHFAKEAMDELVDCVTKDRYAKKLVIILAGYEDDINRLMNTNPGLTSRFPEVINFRGLHPDECIRLLTDELKAQQSRLASPKSKKRVDLDISVLTNLDRCSEATLVELFKELSQQDNWASARDVKMVAKNIFNKTIGDQDGIGKGHLTIEIKLVETELRGLLNERKSRANHASSRTSRPAVLGDWDPEAVAQLQPVPTPMTAATRITRSPKHNLEADSASEDGGYRKRSRTRSQARLQSQGGLNAVRDSGVSDEVWEQLQRDREAEARREQEYQELLKAYKEAREEDREKIVRKLLEEEDRRKKEAEAQRKLEMRGICPMGYSWIRQAAGYRCAGGSHFMSGDSLDKV